MLEAVNPPPRTKKIIYLVPEDWFFVSHFLPMARAAQAKGYDVTVLTRVTDKQKEIERDGFRLVKIDWHRGGLNPVRLIAEAFVVWRLLRRERPAAIHCIAIRMIVVGGFASLLVEVGLRVYAITGLGFFGRSAVRTKWLAFFVKCINYAGAKFVFENNDDLEDLGLQKTAGNVVVVGGAGVDPDAYRPSALPGRPTLKIAMVSRMLRSKGVLTAVQAIQLCRSQGVDVTMSLYGAPDESNSETITREQLVAFDEIDGVTWFGQTQDVASVWARHHFACLPSRREGLPRSLLEAASCGRPIITTDVAGCRHLVKGGAVGFLAKYEDVASLADCFRRAAELDETQLIAMSENARQMVLNEYTEQHVVETVQSLY